MSKKFMSILLSSALILSSGGTALIGAEVSLIDSVQTTQEGENNDLQKINTHKTQYFEHKGTITQIENQDNKYNVLVGTMEEGIQFNVREDQIIIDSATLNSIKPSELKEGMSLTVIIPKDAPMTMSIPGMISEQAMMVVNSGQHFVESSYFNEEWINEENTLALKLDESTMIHEINSKEVHKLTKEEIKNKDLVVFYKASTRSVPAQTHPQLVFVLESHSVEPILENKASIPSSKGEISIRELADIYGYEVKWDNKSKVATLKKATNEWIFKVNESTYYLNKIEKKMSKVARLEKGKLLVENEIEQQMAEIQ